MNSNLRTETVFWLKKNTVKIFVHDKTEFGAKSWSKIFLPLSLVEIQLLLRHPSIFFCHIFSQLYCCSVKDIAMFISGPEVFLLHDWHIESAVKRLQRPHNLKQWRSRWFFPALLVERLFQGHCDIKKHNISLRFMILHFHLIFRSRL